ncbi:MAG TPA: hypothetical protein VM598_01190 [Bdellovibrionota bacterium]|nr:hypothetical protein [Bdellovibrionota bacterium]
MFSLYRQPLVVFGLALYLLSLLQGLTLAKFRNPRMALSTHLTGLMIGIYSLALAGVAELIDLDGFRARAAFHSHVAGNLLLVVSLGLAAWWNTQSMTPIAGAKKPAAASRENLVKIGIAVSSAIIVLSCSLILSGAI